MSGEYYQLLWRRALRFMVRAERDYSEGDYDGACFNAEEALQLAVKALLYRYFAETPRIHGSRSLLARLRNLLMDAGRGREAGLIEDYASRRRGDLVLLEESYIMARYGSVAYGRLQAERCLSAAREGLEVLRRVEEGLGGLRS